jgi:hypothetical protein
VKSGALSDAPAIPFHAQNQHPKFPEGGKMSQYLENMKVGDRIAVRGPSGKITYTGPGRVHVERGKMKESEYKRAEDELFAGVKAIAMIAGGTGISVWHGLAWPGLAPSTSLPCDWLLYTRACN